MGGGPRTGGLAAAGRARLREGAASTDPGREEREGAELRRQVLLFKGRARSAEDSAKFKETLLAEKRANFKKKGLALRDYDEPRPELVAPQIESDAMFVPTHITTTRGHGPPTARPRPAHRAGSGVGYHCNEDH